MSTVDEIQIILQSRAFNYLAFQSVFGTAATKTMLVAVSGDAALQSFEVYAASGQSAYAEALQLARDTFEALDIDSDETVDRLRSEYTRLFVGPGNLDAPPWESMYTTSQRTLFQENTLAVRNFYRSQGFLPVEYPRVADDHIALELGFLAQLGERAKAEYLENYGTAKAAIAASQQFIEEHLLVWLPIYVSGLSRATDASFYPIIARLTLEFVISDKLVLDELLVELS